MNTISAETSLGSKEDGKSYNSFAMMLSTMQRGSRKRGKKRKKSADFDIFLKTADFLVMVTTNGITENEHAKDVNQSIVLDDLF